MVKKILSMDENFIHQKDPWMENSYPWINVSSMAKMTENFFICVCHPWMKSTNKVDG